MSVVSRWLVGTSGFGYAAWKGKFYPANLPSRKFLAYYAERFSAVEINNSFYRLPTEQTVASWRDEVPPGFQFALKAPATITHRKRLRQCEEDVRRFLAVAGTLGPRQGPVLFQLPPNFAKDPGRLENFLSALPRSTRFAVEFRHASWFDEDTFATLRRHGAALCIAEEEVLQTPLVSTADWGYVRLRNEYPAAALAEWSARLRAQPWTDGYVFFRHEDQAKGPRLAAKLLDLLRAA